MAAVVAASTVAVVPTAAIVGEDLTAAMADDQAPTEACAALRRPDAIPALRDLGPGRAAGVPVTPRPAGIHLRRATERARPEDRAFGLRLQLADQLMEDRPMEDRPI
jgi:hypothetical protein